MWIFIINCNIMFWVKKVFFFNLLKCIIVSFSFRFSVEGIKENVFYVGILW